jgi:hypothetical protein
MTYVKNRDGVLVQILRLLEESNGTMTKPELRSALCYNKPFHKPNTLIKGLATMSYLNLVSIRNIHVEILPGGKAFLASAKEEK